jgi:type VI secretion system secreted protein Hcp
VLSYEQSVSHPAPPGGAGGAGAGRAIFSGVRFRKPIDKGSVSLLLACASGKHIIEGLFTFRRIGPPAVEFYKVKLSDVMVTGMVQTAGTGTQYPLSFTTLDAGTDSAGFLDEVTLDYSKIQWEYQPVGPDGKPLGSPATGGWDLKANKKI